MFPEMTEDYDSIDEAHEIWETLHTLLNEMVFAMIDAAKLNTEQEEYVINKLHEEHRYWRDL